MDLTIPEPGSTTARRVLSRALSGLVQEINSIDRAPGAGPAASTLGALARTLSNRAPGALASFLLRPTASALLRVRRTTSEAAAREALDAQLAALLAFELSLQGSLEGRVSVERPPQQLLSLSRRRAVRLPEGTRNATFEGTRIEARTAEGTSTISLASAETEPVYHTISSGVVLALADNNPLAMVEAHPDKEGNAIDLGGRTADVWARALETALGPIERHLPDLRGELELFAQQIVPVGWDEQRHLSASYQEAIGTVYLSLHPSTLTLTEAVIHEASHNKLNALFELDPVLENADQPLFSSPVRPDPRPLRGVLLALHAFLPVARLYEKMIEAGDSAVNASVRERYAAVRRMNRQAADVILPNARATPVGRQLLDELGRWTAHYDAVG